MGLKLRCDLFFGVHHPAVYEALERFWTEHGHRLVPVPVRRPPERGFREYMLYRSDGPWTLLKWDGGWEWTLRREAQLHVSRTLSCPGLLVFVDDGDYWGYELFDDGQEVDHFVQRREQWGTWFPGRDCSGRPELLVEQFPGLDLKAAHVAAYLVQEPGPDEHAAYERWAVPARPGRDRFSRDQECAVLDFLALLGVGNELRSYDGGQLRCVTLRAQPWRAFEVHRVSSQARRDE